MSDSSTLDFATPAAASGTPPGGQSAQPAVPPLVLSSQYVRDLTFRVPGAPGIYAVQQIRPHVVMHLDVQVRQAQENHPVYEVGLLIQCHATTQPPVEGQDAPPTAFVIDLMYCGIFTLQNVAANVMEPVLLAECPRLLFPFARNVLADITREAGFPPVMLQPIDFVAMWQDRRAAAARAAGQGAVQGGAPAGEAPTVTGSLGTTLGIPRI